LDSRLNNCPGHAKGVAFFVPRNRRDEFDAA